MHSRLIRALLALVALTLLAGVGFSALVVDWLRPDRPEPELTARPVPSGPPPLLRRSVTPTGDDPTACGLEVVVTGPDGAPEPDVPVTLDSLTLGQVAAHRDVVHTDDAGVVVWADAPCGEYDLHAQRPGLVGASAHGKNPPGETTREHLRLLEGAGLRGRVVDEQGEGIADASVGTGATHVLTDHRGRFSLHTAEADVGLAVSAFGYSDAYETWPMDDAEEHEVEIILERAHQVRVHCAGRPDDACMDLQLMCTEPMLPYGTSCAENGHETICTCPEGDAAVRGGSRSVFVREGETDVWLDFTDTGRLTGRVTFDGETVDSCHVDALRIPEGLEDLPRGMVSALRTRCGPEGAFAMEGLPEGDWELMVSGSLMENAESMSTLPKRVRSGQTTDLGTIDLRDGGSIMGVLVDGLTGETMCHTPIIALRTARRGERTTPMIAQSAAEGAFTITGLPPGRWRLAHPLSPHEYTEVIVEDGVITDGVEVVTSEANALNLNGFDVAHLGDDLVVESVAPGTPADLAGLQPGDRITGVKLAGFDLTGMSGGTRAKASRAILAHYDGPGVTLAVTREGEGGGDNALEVPLEW